MGCTTCGGAGAYGPGVILPTPRQAMPGVGGLVLVEWQGDVPLTMQTSERAYLFTADRRRLYMTSADYAAAAATLDGIVIVEQTRAVTTGGVADPATP